jgi:hypothetical protein
MLRKLLVITVLAVGSLFCYHLSTGLAYAASSSAFAVTTPQNGATVSGTITVAGTSGSEWVNVAVYDNNNNGAKVGADVTPSGGKWSTTVNTAVLVLVSGDASISVVAFSVPAGHSGGTSTSVNLSLVVSSSGSSCSVTNSPYVPSGYGTNGCPTWDDEFKTLAGDICNATTQTAGCNWYTQTAPCCGPISQSQYPTNYAAIAGGGVTMSASKSHGQWVGSSMATTSPDGKGSNWTYGYWEIKLSLPGITGSGANNWAAAWFNAFNGSSPPSEFDLVEQGGNEQILSSGQYQLFVTMYNWDNPNSAVQLSGSCWANVSNPGNTQIYGLLWTPTRITAYQNGVEMCTQALPSNPVTYGPTTQLGVMLDMGLENTSNPTPPNPTTMDVYYVRYYAP